MKYLVVIDIQNDFVSGALKNDDALPVVAGAAEKIRSFAGKVIFTRDTHGEDYLSSQEGKFLPVPHCIRGTDGWQIVSGLDTIRKELDCPVIDKPSFGSMELAEFFREENKKEPVESIELIGLDTDICVISNALILKAALPEVPVLVDAALCAGTTPENHQNALNAMKICQICVKEG